MVTLETTRLVLRPWRPADRDRLWEINREPAVTRHLNPIDRAGSDALFDRLDAHFGRLGWGPWAVEDRLDATLIGLCGLMDLDAGHPIGPTVEIAWRLSTAWHGKGFAREAATASLRFAFGPAGLPRVDAITVPANTASWGLMERLGMTRLGSFDHPALPIGDRRRLHVHYRITAEEWARQPP